MKVQYDIDKNASDSFINLCSLLKPAKREKVG